MNAAVSFSSSANGAASYQPGATPQEQCPPPRQGLKARAKGRAVGPGFQPSWIGETVTQGVAPLGLRQEYFVVFLNVQSKYILL